MTSLVGVLAAAAACGDGDAPGAVDAPADTSASDSAPVDSAPLDSAPFDTRVDGSTVDVDVVATACPRPFLGGPYGVHRGDVAADATLPLVSGGALVLSEVVDGCSSVVFVGDELTVSALDATNLWDSDADLAALVARSPDDVRYVFVSTAADAATATARLAAMQARVDATVAALDAPARAHWQARLHVVATRAAELAAWPGAALRAHLRPGFAIDHAQRIRGIGALADVTRYDQALADAEQWPWRGNLAYLAHEAWYLRAEAARAAALAAEPATVVPVFAGETLAELAEADVTLPDAATLATFDTLTIEITLQCPDPDKPELGNCGAWDYIASLSLVHPAGGDQRVELARFITPYHREAHWVVDASAALAFLGEGGARRLRWDFAPSWNTQPTATWLTFRFSNRGSGMRPTRAVPLFVGGDFGSAYNAAHPPITTPVPATAARVALWVLVTGHGSGTSQCAEFCAHQHWFEVGGASYVKGFPEAGVPDGCVAAVADGMTPNQGGTWWFGRGGWCPGAPVAPWVIDITGDVTPGQDATIAYRGALAGREPPDGAGNIVLTSYLIIYE